MVMMLPDNLKVNNSNRFEELVFKSNHSYQIDELSSSLYDLNKFVTRTCLTTYTFLTTYLQDGTTTVESREKVISNTATEERNILKISPTPTAGLTFTQVVNERKKIQFVCVSTLTFIIYRHQNWPLEHFQLHTPI